MDRLIETLCFDRTIFATPVHEVAGSFVAPESVDNYSKLELGTVLPAAAVVAMPFQTFGHCL